MNKVLLAVKVPPFQSCLLAGTHTHTHTGCTLSATLLPLGLEIDIKTKSSLNDSATVFVYESTQDLKKELKMYSASMCVFADQSTAFFFLL